MSEVATARRRPERVVVVGAGIVGLSCAWSLQEHGVEVEVVERHHPGAGASWGNAGYLTPPLTVPLPEPAILRYGFRAVLDPNSPVSLPLMRADAARVRFLAAMARHCTNLRWQQSMSVFRLLNAGIFDAYDAQQASGLAAATTPIELVAGYGKAKHAAGLLDELRGVAASGQHVDLDLLSGAEARELEPHFSERVAFGIRLRNQRYITPSAYVQALTHHVRTRGAKIREATPVTAVQADRDRVTVHTEDVSLDADAVVLANGAWLPALARPHGVKVAMQAGRGYSFTVPTPEPLRTLVYVQAARVAIAPAGDRARVTGLMEFDRPDAPPDPAAIQTIMKSVRPLVDGLVWDERADD
ncbi:MAG: FAD-dependent oxidoreductase, partial [Microlunatus sp.]|nr:FAD-dependent oxidoreductase [Microlunatus sp.]